MKPTPTLLKKEYPEKIKIVKSLQRSQVKALNKQAPKRRKLQRQRRLRRLRRKMILKNRKKIMLKTISSESKSKKWQSTV